MIFHKIQVIHGCLQAKSIILMDSDTVKIWDFSFSRKLKSCNYTVKREQLPVRAKFCNAKFCNANVIMQFLSPGSLPISLDSLGVSHPRGDRVHSVQYPE